MRLEIDPIAWGKARHFTENDFPWTCVTDVAALDVVVEA